MHRSCKALNYACKAESNLLPLFFVFEILQNTLPELIIMQPSREVWVIAEINDNGPVSATYELLGKARELADIRNAVTSVVALGNNISRWNEEFSKRGVAKVYLADAPELGGFQDEIYAGIISEFAKKYRPEIILGAATVRGRSLMPRAAVMLQTGLTADCTGLAIQPDTGKLLQTRPAFGGNLLATILCNTFPQMSTVRPHVFKAPETGVAVSENMEVIPFHGEIPAPGKEILEYHHFEDGGDSLADTDIIVTAGMGVGGPEGVKLIKQLADKLGGAVGASRSVVDSGWLEYSHQVGQTGVTVHPKIYIACGVSGAIQHLVGMQNAEFIVAVNRDPEAPVFGVADVAVTGDINEVIPALLAQLG